MSSGEPGNVQRRIRRSKQIQSVKLTWLFHTGNCTVAAYNFSVTVVRGSSSWLLETRYMCTHTRGNSKLISSDLTVGKTETWTSQATWTTQGFPIILSIMKQGFPIQINYSVFKPMADTQRSLSSSNCNDRIADALHNCGHRHQNWNKLFWNRTANNKTILLGFSHFQLSWYQVH